MLIESSGKPWYTVACPLPDVSLNKEGALGLGPSNICVHWVQVLFEFGAKTSKWPNGRGSMTLRKIKLRAKGVNPVKRKTKTSMSQFSAHLF
jgi:hypothetical protein